MNPAALKAAISGDITNAIAASTPGGIEAQEAAGQRDLCESFQLPRQMSGCTIEQLHLLGFEVGDVVDELFRAAKLPPGWTIVATEHSMHSDLVDQLGRRRGGVFYKAAFYDRKAFLTLLPRFSVDTFITVDEEGRRDENEGGFHATAVMDGNVEAYRAGHVPRHDYAGMDALERKAVDWLESNRPDWQNRMAYWGPDAP